MDGTAESSNSERVPVPFCNFHGQVEAIVIDGLKSYPAAMRELGNEDYRKMGEVAQQSSRELTPAAPMTRASNTAISPDEIATEVRLGTCLVSQSLQPAALSRRPSNLQDLPYGRPGRVAKPRGLKPSALAAALSIGVDRRQVAVRPTTPRNFTVRSPYCNRSLSSGEYELISAVRWRG